jgi:hypothetical protein
MISFFVGPVAQLVEQRIENPRVDGSIPSQATRIQPQEIARFLGLFLFCPFIDGHSWRHGLLAATAGVLGGIGRRVIKSRQFKDLHASASLARHRTKHVFSYPEAGPFAHSAATRQGRNRCRTLRPTINGISAQRLCMREARPILLWAGSSAGTRRAALLAWRTSRSATWHSSFTEFHGDPQRR